MFSRAFTEKKFLLTLIILNLVLRFYRIWEPTFSYFDEKTYYLPAARAYLSGLTDPNFEHPPLAKELIALGIKLFGDNAFGWRFFQVLLATAAVVTVYFLTKKINKGKRLGAGVAAVLLTFEFSWFTTSRIGLPEIFMASFLLFSSYFIYSFVVEGKNRNLFIGGLFLGLSLASKWTALIFLPVCFLLLIWTFHKNLWKAAPPFLLLVAIAACVYFASYLPYLQKHSVVEFITLQKRMLTFHTNEQEIKVRLYAKKEGERGYSPLVWPLNYLYSFYAEQQEGQVSVVLFLYNPFVLWFGLALVAYKTATFFKKRWTREEAFLISSFLIFWLVWFFAPRNSYPYYWLAGIPFITILIGKFSEEVFAQDRFAIAGGLLAVITIFLFYYPLLTALQIPVWYLRILSGFIGIS